MGDGRWEMEDGGWRVGWWMDQGGKVGRGAICAMVINGDGGGGGEAFHTIAPM